MGRKKRKLDRENLTIADYERALAAKEKKLGKDAPALVAPSCELYQLYVAQGKHEQAEGMVRKVIPIQQKALGENHEEIAKSLKALAGQLSKQRKFAEAEAELRRAVKILEIVHGTENHIAMELYLDDLCGTLAEQHRDKEILPLGERMRAMQEKEYGPDDVRVAVTLRKLGLVHYRLQDKKGSERLLLGALAIRDKLNDPAESAQFELADLLQDVGNHFVSAQRYEVAEGYFERAQKIWKGLSGKGIADANYALSIFHTGTMYEKWGRVEGAEERIRKAIALCESVPHSNTSPVAHYLNALGELLEKQGRLEEARASYEQALVREEQVHGKDSAWLGRTLKNLSAVLRRLGMYERAEVLAERSLAAHEKEPNPKPNDTALYVKNLALASIGLRKFRKTEELARRGLAIREKSFGPNHHETGAACFDLGNLFYQEQRWCDAEPFFQRALEIWEATLEPQHPMIASALDYLGQIRLHADDHDQAEALLLRAVAIREKVLGRDHPDTANSLNNLASVYLTQDLFDMAEPLLLRSIAAAEKSPATNPGQLAATCCNLGVLYFNQQNYEQAERLSRKSLAINENAYGPDSRQLDQSLQSLAASLRAMDREAEAQKFEEWSRRIEST